MVEVEKSIEVNVPSELRNNSAYKSAMKEVSINKKAPCKSEMKPSYSQPQSVCTSCCQSNFNDSKKHPKSTDDSRKLQKSVEGKSKRKKKGKNKSAAESSEDGNKNIFSTEK